MVIYGLKITINENNIHIENSYNVELPIVMREVLEELKRQIDASEFKIKSIFNYRSIDSMVNEWIAHNNLYKLGYKPERTGSVDLNYPQPWYASICYWLLSRISL